MIIVYGVDAGNPTAAFTTIVVATFVIDDASVVR
jgi:hypothetical protein